MDKWENEFKKLTGMLPPGKSEPHDIIDTDNYSRLEVRNKLYQMFYLYLSERERAKNLAKLVQKLDEYVSMLGEELSETITCAYSHGWESSRVAIGEQMRKEIAEIRRRVEGV